MEQAEQDVSVRAALGLQQAAVFAGPGESWLDSSKDPLQLLLAGKEPQEKVLELARPQLALVPLGYSVSLLLWDPHGPETQLPFQSVIWQVIDTVFQELEALGDATQSLQMVSLVQVSSHNKAWDLLCPDGRALQVMDVAPLGLMVEEATEVAVPDAQAAISAYARGLGAIPALFQGECREPGAVCLPWIVERLLEGNSLTFLLLCVSLPGSLWDWDALWVPPP
ncbi:uncharacterized protein LOC121364609 [Pyrgilauda ruficollis]|uniref:uncharacterized protein LOC121364609 n=1 Tax=Pyrgilauda ruficollis TaxID=221976 RepID=UPI001B85F367|nr:uncharacterized protein LOC121364609 [Pyrgilauda ruficollis]